MKKLKHFAKVLITLILAIFILANTVAASENGTGDDGNSGGSPISTYYNDKLQSFTYDSAGNLYSGTTWPSLSAAMARYGYDQNYSACYVRYNGRVYNYCFVYSDNTRCYFRVSGK